jgi:hypothetical protein
LDFFNINSIPSPFPLIATSLHFPAISSTMNLNLFVVDYACENP